MSKFIVYAFDGQPFPGTGAEYLLIESDTVDVDEQGFYFMAGADRRLYAFFARGAIAGFHLFDEGSAEAKTELRKWYIQSCGHVGAKIDAGAVICPHCGKEYACASVTHVQDE